MNDMEFEQNDAVSENPEVEQTVASTDSPVENAIEEQTAEESVVEEQETETTVLQNGPDDLQEAENEPVSDEEPSIDDTVFYESINAVNNPKKAQKSNLFLKTLCWVLVAVFVFVGGTATGYWLSNSKAELNKNSERIANPKGQVDASKLYDDSAEMEIKDTDKDAKKLTAAGVYEKVNPAVVGIRVYNENGAAADASGVIFDKKGYIITNDHIYSEVGAAKFRVYLYDGTEYDADYVAGDVVSDLAVLKIRNPKDLQPAEFGDSEKLVCGEDVVAIGRPSDATSASTVTQGIVSMTGRRVQSTSNYSARLIQTDAAINSGSSGGALANMYGQIVGITSNKMSTTNGFEGMGYAIPTKTVKRNCEQLIAKGKITDRAKLGISYYQIDSVTAALGEYDTVGLYIETISEESELYGKVKKGDVITHVNGIALTDDDVILDIIENAHPGDTIKLTILSGKTSKDYTVKLKANTSESSYSDVLTDLPNEDSNGEKSEDGGTFNFPDGE